MISGRYRYLPRFALLFFRNGRPYVSFRPAPVFDVRIRSGWVTVNLN